MQQCFLSIVLKNRSTKHISFLVQSQKLDLMCLLLGSLKCALLMCPTIKKYGLSGSLDLVLLLFLCLFSFFQCNSEALRYFPPFFTNAIAFLWRGLFQNLTMKNLLFKQIKVSMVIRFLSSAIPFPIVYAFTHSICQTVD